MRLYFWQLDYKLHKFLSLSLWIHKSKKLLTRWLNFVMLIRKPSLRTKNDIFCYMLKIVNLIKMSPFIIYIVTCLQELKQVLIRTYRNHDEITLWALFSSFNYIFDPANFLPWKFPRDLICTNMAAILKHSIDWQKNCINKVIYISKSYLIKVIQDQFKNYFQLPLNFVQLCFPILVGKFRSRCTVNLAQSPCYI